ncbi:hypothetical protein EP7_005333 [Isosphaeraceae bacterium EP7]
MDSLLIAAAVFACSIAGAAGGGLLRRFVPESHLNGESKDVVKQGFGLIATMVALVIGLLVASAKSQFDSESDGFKQLSTNLILLDRSLAHYGPETKAVRESLRQAVESIVEKHWPNDKARPVLAVDAGEITAHGEALIGAIRDLAPKGEFQSTIKAQAIDISRDLAKTRWTLSQPLGPLLPTPFLFVLAFWLAILFASFGLLTPRNGTVVVTLALCALSLSGAIFLIADLGQPATGLIQIPSTSLRYALSQLGK